MFPVDVGTVTKPVWLGVPPSSAEVTFPPITVPE